MKITDVPELTDGAQGYNLIVVDGTWAQAKGIFWSNSVLHKPLQVSNGERWLTSYIQRPIHKPQTESGIMHSIMM